MQQRMMFVMHGPRLRLVFTAVVHECLVHTIRRDGASSRAVNSATGDRAPANAARIHGRHFGHRVSSREHWQYAYAWT